MEKPFSQSVLDLYKKIDAIWEIPSSRLEALHAETHAAASDLKYFNAHITRTKTAKRTFTVIPCRGLTRLVARAGEVSTLYDYWFRDYETLYPFLQLELLTDHVCNVLAEKDVTAENFHLIKAVFGLLIDELCLPKVTIDQIVDPFIHSSHQMTAAIEKYRKLSSGKIGMFPDIEMQTEPTPSTERLDHVL